MKIKYIKVYMRNTGCPGRGVSIYAYPHEEGYVISQPIYYSDIGDEDDPDVLVYRGSHISVDILDKDGNVIFSNVESGFTLKLIAQDKFPIKIKVNLLKSAYRQKLEYAQIVFNKFYGYVYDSEGNPVAGATIELTQTDDSSKKFTTTTDIYGYFEIYNLDNSKTYNVNITKNGQLLYNDTIQPPLYRVYGTPPQDDNNGGGNSSGQYGDPNSKYVVELSSGRIYEGQKVQVFVIGKGTGWFGTDVYVEGAEIYVDGRSTGVKTEYHNWWEPWFGWVPWINPYAEITLYEPGVHYIYAKLPDGSYSKASPITVLSLSGSGSGSENGTYPSTPPESKDGDVVEYILFAHPVVLYEGGEVTFKVYKYVNGKNKGTVEAEIWINGEFVGKTTRSGWGDFELKHKFMSANVYYVYAVVDGKRTGTMQIRVLSKGDQVDRPVENDNGDIILTVKVVDTFGKPLAGIYVERWTSDYVLKERTVTNSDGIAILHPQSGVEYLIIAYDLGNKYLSASKKGSWTSDSSITLVMGKAGDLNDDGKPDTSVRYIQVRIDGYAEDGHKFFVGKHRISVVDQNGMEIAGAEIYINGEYIGKTGGWGGIFGAGLDHRFGAGNYTIRAVYGDLADTITIRVIDAIDPNNPDKPCLFAKPDHAEALSVGNITAYVNEPVLFIVATPNGATSIWDWDKVSGAIIYIDGEQVGVTGKTQYGGINVGPIHFGTYVGYVHHFNSTGTYEVYAITPDGDRTNTIYVTVVEGPAGEGWIFDNPVMQFFKGIALTVPILGDWHIDAVIWLIIALIVVSIVVRIII
jgi:protocatechuate 3,4-dioxygenase beta subunit